MTVEADLVIRKLDEFGVDWTKLSKNQFQRAQIAIERDTKNFEAAANLMTIALSAGFIGLCVTLISIGGFIKTNAVIWIVLCVAGLIIVLAGAAFLILSNLKIAGAINRARQTKWRFQSLSDKAKKRAIRSKRVTSHSVNSAVHSTTIIRKVQGRCGEHSGKGS